MSIMTFIQKHTDQAFLAALDTEKQYTAAFIAKKIGCGLSTAKTYLNKLAASGEVKKIPIDDGATYVYLRVKQ